MERLQQHTLFEGLDRVAPETQIGHGQWTTADGTIEGRAATGPSVLPIPARAANVMMTCQIQPEENGEAGLVWRWNANGAYAAIVDANTDSVRVVSLQVEDAKITERCLDKIVGLNLPEGPKRLRVLVRAHRSEIYCNDRWLFNVHTPESQEAEGLGLIVCSNEAQFTRLHVGEIGPMRVQSPE